MEIDIEKILEAIAQMQTEELNKIMTAIEKRLDELESATPEARGLRAAVRAARARRGTPAKGKGGTTVLSIVRGMREVR